MATQQRKFLPAEFRMPRENQELIDSYRRLQGVCEDLLSDSKLSEDKTEINLLIYTIESAIIFVQDNPKVHRPKNLWRGNLLPVINRLLKKSGKEEISI